MIATAISLMKKLWFLRFGFLFFYFKLNHFRSRLSKSFFQIKKKESLFKYILKLKKYIYIYIYYRLVLKTILLVIFFYISKIFYPILNICIYILLIRK